MEPLAMEDDICILKHETAYVPAESPVSACPGDESVASHFALVTAYEDIKERLRDTERENTLLRRRVKQLEDKLYKPDEASTEGQQYVNKAYSAYRGLYIEKKDLQMELTKLRKEKSEEERILTEQLQARDLELLQLRTEMETNQVMRTLHSAKADAANSDSQIQTLQQELEKMKLECKNLQERCQKLGEKNIVASKETQEAEFDAGGVPLLQTYRELRRAMLSVCTETRAQAKVLKKLRDARRASSALPVQCLDDVERNKRAPRPPSAPPVPSSAGRPCPPSGPLLLGSFNDDCLQGVFCPSQHVCAPTSQRASSLDDSSWSFPSTPKPSDALFWENTTPGPAAGITPKSPGSEWVRPY